MKNKTKLIVGISILLIILAVIFVFPYFKIINVLNNYEKEKAYLLDKSTVSENFDKTEVLDAKIEISTDKIKATDIIYFPNLQQISFGVLLDKNDDITNYSITVLSKSNEEYVITTTMAKDYFYKNFQKFYVKNIVAEDIEKIVIS